MRVLCKEKEIWIEKGGKHVKLNEMGGIERIGSFEGGVEVEGLVGMIVLQGEAHLLAILKSELLRVVDGVGISIVKGLKWFKVKQEHQIGEYQVSAEDRMEDKKRVDSMKELPMEGLYYYSRDKDMTRGYGYEYVVNEYDPEYCWNVYLREKWEEVGMGEWVVVLVQGSVGYKTFSSGESMLMKTRRSNKYVGTRYSARGTNSVGGVGNEAESEVVYFKEVNGEILEQWFEWRRGTVPLGWKSEVVKGVGEAKIKIEPEKTRDMYVERYWKGIIHKYGYQVVVVSLLRLGVQQEERALSEAYEKSLQLVQQQMRADVEVIKIDWHRINKKEGESGILKEIWTHVGKAIRRVGVAERRRGKDGLVREGRKQCGVVRMNCLDSLDRTNMAGFYMALMVVYVMLQRILSRTVVEVGEAGVEPMEVIRQQLRSEVLVGIAEMFVYSGDIHSMIYTNSPALHTSMIRSYAPGMNPARNNAIISIQRRIQNVVKDSERQIQYEMILGKKRWKYMRTVRKDRLERVRLEVVHVTPGESLYYLTCPSKVVMVVVEGGRQGCTVEVGKYEEDMGRGVEQVEVEVGDRVIYHRLIGDGKMMSRYVRVVGLDGKEGVKVIRHVGKERMATMGEMVKERMQQFRVVERGEMHEGDEIREYCMYMELMSQVHDRSEYSGRYPLASIMQRVRTKADTASIDTVLMGRGKRVEALKERFYGASYWQSAGEERVDILIRLGEMVDVGEVLLGGMEEALEIRLWVSSKGNTWEPVNVQGEWVAGELRLVVEEVCREIGAVKIGIQSEMKEVKLQYIDIN